MRDKGGASVHGSMPHACVGRPKSGLQHGLVLGFSRQAGSSSLSESMKESEGSEVSQALTAASAWGATVRGTYPTPEAGTRTQYVLYVGPWGQAALRLRYVHNAGGWYA